MSLLSARLRMLVLGLVLLVRAAAAQGPPPGYYDTVDESSPSALRVTLHAVIDDHLRFPYTSASTDTWDILNDAQTDPSKPGNIIDIYRNASIGKISGGVGPYNREHTWPKSYGFPNNNSQNYPYTDCHMLRLCDPGYNSARSNKPFRTCSPGCQEYTTVLTNGLGGGSGTYPGNSNWTSGSFTSGTWEVWSGRRGDVARALFYADVRYEGGTHGITGAPEPDLILTDQESLIASSNTGNNESVAYMGMLSTLLAWHQEDPVDAWEQNRNDVVFSYQGNRNPFVDHPEWVDCLFNGVCGGPPPAPVAAFSGTPTSGAAPLSVSFTDQSTGQVTSWSWDFGDGGTATVQNPTYTYTQLGTFTVVLTVTGPGGSDTDTKVDYVSTTVPPPVAYCTAKVNSQFCFPQIAWSSGVPSVSDPNPFLVSTSQVINNKNGLLFYGYAPTSVPFQGGTLCVTPPLRRTPPQNSGGNPPPDDCSGTLSFDFNAHVQSGLDPFLVAGAEAYAQFWYRDPADIGPFDSGLSNAVHLTIGP